tara:strand:- start:427 stop:1623 length:1197 start_codon:yes stop_codon:yes gene_type:complete
MSPQALSAAWKSNRRKKGNNWGTGKKKTNTAQATARRHAYCSTGSDLSEIADPRGDHSEPPCIQTEPPPADEGSTSDEDQLCAYLPSDTEIDLNDGPAAPAAPVLGPRQRRCRRNGPNGKALAAENQPDDKPEDPPGACSFLQQLQNKNLQAATLKASLLATVDQAPPLFNTIHKAPIDAALKADIEISVDMADFGALLIFLGAKPDAAVDLARKIAERYGSIAAFVQPRRDIQYMFYRFADQDTKDAATNIHFHNLAVYCQMAEGETVVPAMELDISLVAIALAIGPGARPQDEAARCSVVTRQEIESGLLCQVVQNTVCASAVRLYAEKMAKCTIGATPEEINEIHQDSIDADAFAAAVPPPPQEPRDELADELNAFLDIIDSCDGLPDIEDMNKF